MKNKKLLLSRVLTALFFSLCFLTISTPIIAKDFPVIYLFYGTGCPHCAQVEKYFEDQDLLNKYSVEKKEIYFNRDNAILFNKLLSERGIPTEAQGVPAVVIGNKAIVGDKPIIENFIPEAEIFLQQTEEQFNLNSESQKEAQDQRLDLTIAVVIGASIVDAINPCAFAVLIILMTTILATGNGKKALKAGVAFASSIFVSYFLMGLGLYKALGIGEVSGLSCQPPRLPR
ncbi:hypothetical protein ACFL0Y_00540 [Patescibacteria group bacterium]